MKRRTAKISPALRSRFPNSATPFAGSGQDFGAALFEDIGRGEEVALKIELRRRRTQERGAQDPALVQAAEGGAEAPVPLSYDRVTDEQMSSAIQRLSPRVRSAMELHVQGRKYREIASELGIPSGTVAKRLHLARAKLRTLLEPLMRQGEH